VTTLHRPLFVATALAASALARPAHAADPTREGAEFLDPPDGAAASAPQEVPKDDKTAPGYVSGYRRTLSVGMSPHAPQGYISVPGVTPSFSSPTPDKGARFEFHGYLQAPIRVGIGDRQSAAPGQSSTTLHGDPLVAGGAWGWFDHTATVPGPWAQLNFLYGDDVVQATAIIGAWNLSESMTASTYFQAPSQVGFKDVFVTYKPKTGPISTKLMVGVYPERYGAMAQYTTGAFGTALIGTIFGMGTTATVLFPFEHDLDLKIEGGLKGDLNHPPVGLIPEPSNDFASSVQGSTFAGHLHASLGYREIVTAQLHYISSWSQDDRSDGFDDPTTAQNEALTRQDGTLKVAGADAVLNGGRFGYLYLGGAKVSGHHTESLHNLVQVQDSGGGKDLSERFFGPASSGTGGMILLGAQYILSLGTLLRYPQEFDGVGPDLTISAFGISGHVTSEDPAYDGKNMFKYGAEVTYSMLPWLAASGRFDHVVPDTSDTARSYAILSPKLVFRTDWSARESLTLQYATWLLGDRVVVNGDTRLLNVAAGGRPDKNMFAIYGTIWW